MIYENLKSKIHADRIANTTLEFCSLRHAQNFIIIECLSFTIFGNWVFLDKNKHVLMNFLSIFIKIT